MDVSKASFPRARHSVPYNERQQVPLPAPMAAVQMQSVHPSKQQLTGWAPAVAFVCEKGVEMWSSQQL